MKNVEYRVTFVFLLMMVGIGQLCAQKPDTLYIYETVTEHDTLFSRDTTPGYTIRSIFVKIRNKWTFVRMLTLWQGFFTMGLLI